jgi:5'-nucleotidase
MLAAGLVVGTPALATAQSAPTQITLLNINDFHGRIDANTVRFAATVERERANAPGGEANTLFLSAGDNIGASLFASSSQRDQPTLDVLNALDLASTAVGNHEFDAGFADLTDRVVPASEFPILGANVYRRGTTTPAMPEYSLHRVGGVTVGVIGAVTQLTPSLVSPGGIADLDFGDPVDAVNRVAAVLTDGDAANGEADVLVAEYHEGAGASTADGSSAEQERAAGGAFGKIVDQTSGSVDVIFTGHTHKEYAWSFAKPGGGTRPVVQTGSYGERVGKVVLTLAGTEVVSHTETNVARLPAPTATNGAATDDQLAAQFPRVAEVQRITRAAIAAANEIGRRQVGTVAADITTAFRGGDYTGPGGTYQGPTRDTRSQESTLGNLVANGLRDSLRDPQRGGATIGVTNPGGLRAELLRGDDGGVVTLAEANAVQPFANSLFTTTLTGAQFVTLLEQQWQTNAQGEPITTAPYLQLGLSDNVSYTFDPTLPLGSRITSVTIDGQPLDPARGYRIGTPSFLAQGGDNFRVFRSGTDVRDSGLIDADAWYAYLEASSPVTPSFARRAVEVRGFPAAARSGTRVRFDVAQLDLTSLGSPAQHQPAGRARRPGPGRRAGGHRRRDRRRHRPAGGRRALPADPHRLAERHHGPAPAAGHRLPGRAAR